MPGLNITVRLGMMLITILEQARNDDALRIKEAQCISMAEKQTLLNRDQETTIADCWVPLLQRMRITSRQQRAPSTVDS